MAPIRILWLAKGLGPGGMERLLLTHARVGARQEFHYQAAYLVERPHSLVPALRDEGVVCRRLGSGHDFDVRWVRSLRALVRDERIDVVHVHSPLAAAIARPGLRSMRDRPAVLYTEHNSWDCYSGLTRVANAVTYPLDDARIAVSVAAAKSAPRALGHRTEVLVHGIDLDAAAAAGAYRAETRRALRITDDTVVVVTVANLRREKGYDILLDAARRAVDADHRLVFLSVGQGPLADELAVAQEASGLGSRFRLLGFRDDVHRLLAAADVFALASRQEGLPVALMEATALGLPIVAPRVGGLPDVIQDGVSGLLVNPEDPDALAAAIGTIAADDALRARLAAASRALSARFDARAAVAHLESIYRRVAR